jgi:sugar phosphate isomerase/epimerase
MPAQLGAMTLPFCGHPFEKALDGLAQAGFRYICVGLPHQHHFVPHPDDDDSRLRQVLDACSRRSLEPIMLICLTHAEHENGQHIWLKTLRHAAAMEVPYVLGVGTWNFKDPQDLLAGRKTHAQQAAEEDRWIAAMRPVLDEAAVLGIKIVIKPHTGNTATALECRNLVLTVHHPALGICYDAGNVHFYEGVEPQADLPLVVDHVSALCLKDHLGPRFHPDFPPPGEGGINHVGIFEILKKARFHGPLMIERVDSSLDAGHMGYPEIVARLKRAREHMHEAAAKAGLEIEPDVPGR